VLHRPVEPAAKSGQSNRVRVCPLLDNSGQRSILARDGLSANDPQQTSVASNGYLPLVAQARARAATLQINFFL